jgi:hypothetical protein
MDIELAVAFAKRLDNDYYAIAELTESNLKLRSAYAALESRCQKLEAGLQEIVRMCNMKIDDANLFVAIGINHYRMVAEEALAQDEVEK